jgi:hypothetical protein
LRSKRCKKKTAFQILLEQPVYKDLYLKFTPHNGRWEAYRAENLNAVFVVSAKSREILIKKIDKRLSEGITDGENLDNINKCRIENGLSPLKRKERLCLKCGKLFKSVSNRLCNECNRHNTGINSSMV